MDYGVVIAGVGRINEGQKPFVDFVTPLQSATLMLNYGAEAIGGPSFLALTWGNVGLMTLGLLVLWVVLRGYASDAVAWLLSAGVVMCTAGQHTIIWYNGVGTLALAVATWTAAAAPILSRRHWPCHLITTLALILGGMNKLNFHAVTLVLVMAWTLRQGLLGQTSPVRVVQTMAWWFIAGVLLPLGIELGWTGASFATWYHNVIALPGGSRSGLLRLLGTPEFYLSTTHDYYGPVFRPAGLLIGVTLMVIMLAGWRTRQGMDRALLVGAGLSGVAATLLLLVTNREIVYVGLGAGIAIGVSLWIGFGLHQTAARWSRLILIGATLLVISHAHPSTWYGQRHQYGNNAVDRSTYRTVELAPDAPRYFEGVKLAPELAAMLEDVAGLRHWRNARPDNPPRVFFGRSMEGFNRIIPVPPGHPLWQSEVTHGPAELSRLQEAFTAPVEFDLVVENRYWRRWTHPIETLLRGAPAVVASDEINVFQLDSPLTGGLGPENDIVTNKRLYGGNVDSRYLTFSDRMRAMLDEQDRPFFGVGRQQGSMQFELPVREVSADWVAILQRESPYPVQVELQIVALPSPGYPEEHVRWQEVVTFADGPGEYRGTVSVPASDRRVSWRVAVDSPQPNLVIAGWSLPSIQHSTDTLSEPLLPDLAGASDDAHWEAKSRDLPRAFSRQAPPDISIVGHGFPSPAGELELRPGSIVWLRSPVPWSELNCRLQWSQVDGLAGQPVIHVLWYEAGRLEIIQQTGLEPDREHLIHGWPTEDFGWYGLRYDSPAYFPNLKLTEISLSPRS